MELAPPRTGVPRGAIRRPNLGLQLRIMAYVALGSVAVLLFFGYVAHQALEESTRIIFGERLHLAQLAAREVADWATDSGDGNLRILSSEQVGALLARFASPPREGGTALRLSVMDGHGDVAAATDEVSPRAQAEHKVLLAGNLARAEAGVVIHAPANAAVGPHVVAFAPLPGLPGGVTVEESRDAALAVPRALLTRMGTLGAVFVIAGLGLAWLTTWQVVGPLTKLTAITRRIAAGDLSSPVPQAGQDEVRDLAASFEAMRRQLQESHAELARANRELERRVQERTAELELRHGELAAASRLLQEREAERTFLLQKTIQAQEEERRRVARELHDAVGQFLSTLVVRISVLEGQIPPAAPHISEGLAHLRALTSRTVDEVRRLIVDLRPELLDDMGLPAALGWYAEHVLGKQGIAVTVDVDSLQRRLPSQVEVVVFRVVQEAITNILKHARASRVRVALQRDGDDLVGVVEDDGRGFEAGRSAKTLGTGVGLIGMRERVALLGGTLEIRSEPGQGTRLFFRVPARKGEPA